MSLAGKVAFVTGAAQGLGKAFSEALLKKGAKVCLSDIQVSQGETTLAEFQRQYGRDSSLFIKCDVTSPKDFEKAFETVISCFGGLDIMVNNAGIANEHNYALMVNINLTGVITGTNMAIDLMNREKGGRGGVIVNIASTAGITPEAYFAPIYTGTKHGVVGFTRCWSMNPYIAKMGLRFACLCPAFTDTQILCSTITDYPEDAQKIIQQVGINKVETVTEGFMQLVEDNQCNGAVMVITAQNGIQYHRKPHGISRM
ncbi:15-hydroxyprostaglandin dehydrogenase [NAD(+)]-like [Pomacea canaliculata]|uniref:15-hydroxyprostaglandin dehydrogenase [NAD(+)]-like n=1 Tax=Pomacea canaliculata TaxID=400727 RepID=UPI000D73C27C|nr:15-hydroxyprostaglandin dehydrogenase [NAD(+)]-like [Pomacea canaliculata]